jgi:hypothetical protein
MCKGELCVCVRECMCVGNLCVCVCVYLCDLFFWGKEVE